MSAMGMTGLELPQAVQKDTLTKWLKFYMVCDKQPSLVPCACFVLSFLFVSPAWAVEIIVVLGTGAILARIANASDGDTLVLQDGLYGGAGKSCKGVGLLRADISFDAVVVEVQMSATLASFNPLLSFWFCCSRELGSKEVETDVSISDFFILVGGFGLRIGIGVARSMFCFLRQVSVSVEAVSSVSVYSGQRNAL